MKDHNLIRIHLIIILICIGLITSCNAQKQISYPQAFEYGKPRILNDTPDIEGWLDSEHYLEWMSEGKYRKAKLLKVNAGDGHKQELVDFTIVNEKFLTGRISTPWQSCSKDYSLFIISFGDDLYLFNAKDNSIGRLTDTPAKENNPVFSPDAKNIAFTREHDLFLLNLATGKETRLTHDGSDVIFNGWASWIYYEEILGRKLKYKAFWWSPDSKMIAFLRFDDTNVPGFPIIHPESPHEKLEIQHYPKPGDPNPLVKLGVIHLSNGKLIWVDTDEKADHYVAWPDWTPDSKSLLFQWMNRKQDLIRIYKADPITGKKVMINEESQSAWVEFFKDITMLRDGSGFLLRSDRDGWRHLYHYDFDGNLQNQITSGNWDVNEIIGMDAKNEWIYFTGYADNSFDCHLYRVMIDGRVFEKLSKSDGTHSVKILSQGNYYIDTHSNINQPARIDLLDSDGKYIRTIGDKNSPDINDYNWGKVETFMIPTADGVQLPTLWILPPGFDKNNKYPVLFRVYGGPGKADVSNQYCSFSDHYYARQGIIVMYVDHRGSRHFGKKGQVVMHRNLGKWEMQDLISAVEWLREKPFVDEKRIGIMGSSYGGYSVCMALTYGADYFTHGVALLSVTDWRFYDSVYTERYMDQPDENPDGYTFGSVLTHVDKYKGKLLILHGAMDDNVHLQNTSHFIMELQQHKKKFELMVYPNQKHGISGVWRPHSLRTTVNFWHRHFLGEELTVDEPD